MNNCESSPGTNHLQSSLVSRRCAVSKGCAWPKWSKKVRNNALSAGPPDAPQRLARSRISCNASRPDVKARARGLKLDIPLGHGHAHHHLTIRASADLVRFSLRTVDPSEAKVRQASAAAYLANVWRGLRDVGPPVSLTHRQATALAGELYRAWADGRRRSLSQRSHVSAAGRGRAHSRQSGGSRGCALTPERVSVNWRSYGRRMFASNMAAPGLDAPPSLPPR
jgi:hypothetical protein